MLTIRGNNNKIFRHSTEFYTSSFIHSCCSKPLKLDIFCGTLKEMYTPGQNKMGQAQKGRILSF